MKFIVTILESYGGHIIRLLASFFAAKHIPVEDYGLFATLVAGYTFATIVGDFGFNIRLIKGEDESYWMNILVTASIISIVINIFIQVLFQLGSIYLVAFPLSLLALISEFCSSIVLSKQSYYLNAFSNLLGNIAASLLIFVKIIFTTANINVLIYSLLIYYTVRIAVMIKEIRVSWIKQYEISFSATKLLLKRNRQLAYPSLIENAVIRLPIIILARDKIVLGQFSFATQIIELVSNQYIYASNRYIIPRFKKVATVDFNDLFKRFSILNYAVGVLLGLFLFFIVPELLTYGFGDKWNLASYFVRVLAIGVIAKPVVNFLIKIVLIHDIDKTYMIAEVTRHLGKIALPVMMIFLPVSSALLVSSCMDFLIFFVIICICYSLIPKNQYKMNVVMVLSMSMAATFFLSRILLNFS